MIGTLPALTVATLVGAKFYSNSRLTPAAPGRESAKIFTAEGYLREPSRSISDAADWIRAFRDALERETARYSLHKAAVCGT